LNEHGTRRPLFFLHGDLNGGGLYCANLARHLDADRPLFAVHPFVSDPLPRTIDAMADRYLETLRASQPRGPYLLGGYCHGGLVAHEMARRLVAAGEEVPLVVVVDAWAYNTRLPLVGRLVDGWADLRRLDEAGRVDLFLEARGAINRVASATGSNRLRLLATSVRRLWAAQAGQTLDREPRDGVAERGMVKDFDVVTRHAPAVYELYRRAVLAHVPRPYNGRVALFLSEGPVEEVAGQWKRVARCVEVHAIDGDHTSCITTHVASLARALETCLDRVDRRPLAA
jgi:thioesterase domain-containing protein